MAGFIGPRLLTSGARQTVNNSIFILLLVLTAVLSLVDGSNFAYIEITRAIFYGTTLVFLLLNLNNRNVFFVSLSIATFVLVELFVSIFLGESAFGQILKFSALFAAFLTYPYINISLRTQSLALLIACGALGYLLISSFGYYGLFFWGSLSSWMPNINPNSLAAMAFVLFVLISRFKLTNRHIRVVACVAAFIAIFNYESRTILAAMVIYIVLSAVPKLDRLIIKKAIISLSLVFALVLPFAYVAYSQVSVEGYEVSSNEEKKFFSGRQDVWSEVFRSVGPETILTGMGDTGILQRLDVKGLHNAFIATYYHLGFVALVFFCLIFYKTAVKSSDRKIFAYMITLILISSFESTLVDGDYIGILMCLPILDFAGRKLKEGVS